MMTGISGSRRAEFLGHAEDVDVTVGSGVGHQAVGLAMDAQGTAVFQGYALGKRSPGPEGIQQADDRASVEAAVGHLLFETVDLADDADGNNDRIVRK